MCANGSLFEKYLLTVLIYKVAVLSHMDLRVYNSCEKFFMLIFMKAISTAK